MEKEILLSLQERFEREMEKIQRPGIDKLMEYIRKSDFYTAPASTRYHLSCKGGLLLHSLNVLDALRGMMPLNEATGNREYIVAGKVIAAIPDESLTIIALSHDICKTYFYKTGTRNVKNEKTNQWEKVPTYTVEDRMPLGHGDKSAMLVKEYIKLSSSEMYAIWYHMGFAETQDSRTLGKAIQQFPIIWAMHTADMMASSFMEDANGNKEMFAPELNTTAEPAPMPQEAPLIQEGPLVPEEEYGFQEALPRD